MIKNILHSRLKSKKSAECSEVGLDRYKNKTLPTEWERNEKSCGRGTSRWRYRSSRPSSSSPCGSTRRTRDCTRSGCPRKVCTKYLLCHHPSNILGVVFYSAFQMPQHSVPSIFIFCIPDKFFLCRVEVSTYTTLFQTVVGNILDVWILASVAGNHSLPHIHLPPFVLYQNINKTTLYANTELERLYVLSNGSAKCEEQRSKGQTSPDDPSS